MKILAKFIFIILQAATNEPEQNDKPCDLSNTMVPVLRRTQKYGCLNEYFNSEIKSENSNMNNYYETSGMEHSAIEATDPRTPSLDIESENSNAAFMEIESENSDSNNSSDSSDIQESNGNNTVCFFLTGSSTERTEE